MKAPPQFLQNSSGNTALHWAAQNGQIDALKLLQPFLTPDVVLLHNLAGQDCIALAEERASNEKALECAGFLSNLVPETEEEKKDSQKEQQSSTEDVVNEPDEDSSKIKGDEAKATNGIETLDLKDSA